jgi:nucleotide-binding universal stress UspA family protein
MNAIKKILVPIDLVGGARGAIELAKTLAVKFDASIELLHVWQPPPMLPMQLFVVPETGGVPMAAEDIVKSRATAQLQEIAAGLTQAGVSEVHLRVGVGDPAQDIVDLAASARFDLVVMGTHGRSGIKKMFLGSVAEKVVRGSPCPVLTVRAQE